MGHVGVGWVIQEWGGSCRGGVGHVGVRMGHVGVGCSGSCKGGVQLSHVGVGWGGWVM